MPRSGPRWRTSSRDCIASSPMPTVPPPKQGFRDDGETFVLQEIPATLFCRRVGLWVPLAEHLVCSRLSAGIHGEVLEEPLVPFAPAHGSDGLAFPLRVGLEAAPRFAQESADDLVHHLDGHDAAVHEDA